MNIQKIKTDKKYDYLIYKSNNTLHYFFINYKNNKESFLKIKDENNIFIWLHDIIVFDDFIQGVSENNITYKFIKDEIIDWMIVSNNYLLGGYTLRFYIESLNKIEQDNFLKSLSFKINLSEDFFIINNSTAEGTLLLLQDFYNQQNIPKILSLKNFKEEILNICLLEKYTPTKEELKELSLELEKNFINFIQIEFPNFQKFKSNFEKIFEKNNLILIKETLFNNEVINVNYLWLKNINNKWIVLNKEEYYNENNINELETFYV